jgi:hypothetical protein
MALRHKVSELRALHEQAMAVDVPTAVQTHLSVDDYPPNVTGEMLGLSPDQLDWIGLSQEFGRFDNPPPWCTDEEAWNAAKECVAPMWDQYDQPFAVVTDMYNKMSAQKETLGPKGR